MEKQNVKQHSGSFLQSREWGAFQEAVGRRVEWVRVGGRDVLVQWVPLPFGLKYAHVARVEVDEAGLRTLIEHARKGGAVFVRTEPLQQSTSNNQQVKVRDHHPSATRLIDLSLSEETLLAQMKPKTRYNIRLAARKGVEVQEARGVWGVRKFLKLLEKTKERQRFTVHAPEYYEKMLEVLDGRETVDAARCEARLFVARYHGKVRAANIIISYGDTVMYLHGASSDKDQEVMAPYLLHWQTMRWAKEQGFRWYDLWGIAPPGEQNHPLVGVSRFKEGFGGEVVEYPGTFEIPLRRFWYLLIRLHRRLRHLV